MKSNYNYFDNIFSRINGISKQELSDQIHIEKSSHVNVIGNNLGINNTYIFSGSGISFTHNQNRQCEKLRIKFNSYVATDKTRRAIINIDCLERFIFACNHQGIIPTIRYYAFFSHLSSIRRRSDMSEYNQLVLTEKDLFDKMLGLQYHIKLIISLDIPVILTKWYGSMSDTILRMTDLVDNVNTVCENNNIDIVIDEINALDGQYILHDCLYIHALKVDPILKYNITEYETDQNVIRNAISVFDERFSYLSFSNSLIRKHLHAQSIGEFIKNTVDSRVENINRGLS